MGKIYNCPVGNDFLSNLIRVIYGDDLSLLNNPDVANNTIVYLPSSRLVKSLQDKIVESNNYKPIIMPQIKVLGGDSYESDYMSFNFGAIKNEPVNKTYRRFWLAGMIRNFYAKLPQPQNITMSMALKSADIVAKLFDDIDLYETDLDCIDELIKQLDLSAHWEINKTFIQYIKPDWDNTLKQQGLQNIGSYKASTLSMLSEYIYKQNKKVILAGLNPFYPALQRFMQSVADYDNGVVIINAYDGNLTQEQQQNVLKDQTHPLHNIQKFVDSCNMNIQDFCSENPKRQELFTQAFLPAKDTKQWKNNPPSKDGFNNIKFIEAEDSFNEAMVIALMMRHALEKEDETTAFITDDRNLARLVASNLKRWNISIDDSSGMPLHQTPPAVFMRLVANLISEDFSAVSLVDLFKHPFCYSGDNRGDFLQKSRLFEKLVLRQIVGNISLENMNDFIYEQIDNEFNKELDKQKAEELIEFIDSFKQKISPLKNKSNNDFKTMIESHINTCENLSSADKLWAGDDGNALNKIIGDIYENCNQYEPNDINDYASAFTNLIVGESVRSTLGFHPRLYIWGLMEGRLQQVDNVIIGGMLENTMPAKIISSPFLSSTIVEKMGLPSLDSSVGLTAHDLISCCNAKTIKFTKANIESNSQTIPSRWWLRFEAVAKACNIKILQDYYVNIANNIDFYNEEKLEISEPKPTPPLASRPKSLSVTNITKWYNDPYQIYARYILKLFPVGGLDVQGQANINGNIVHKILEVFYKQYGTHKKLNELSSADIKNNLTEIAIAEYDKYTNIVEAQSVWLPRFLNALPNLSQAIKKDNEATDSYIVEEKISFDLTTQQNNNFNFYGRADRIDILQDGSLRIIDYKTGSLPNKTNVRSGQEPQLGLTAYALKNKNKNISDLNYWEIKKDFKLTTNVDGKNEEIPEISYEKLCEQVDLYSDINTPYYYEKANSSYNDYEHLFRQNEWGLKSSDGGYDNE